MPTAREHPDSPRPTKFRTYDTSVAPTIFNNVEKVISGAITPAAARTAITAALATVDPAWAIPPPENWTEFVDGCQKTIDCAEANTNPSERQKLFAAARHYLTGLIDDIVEQEAAYQRDRGLFVVSSQVTNLNYLAGVFGQAVAENQTVSFEA